MYQRIGPMAFKKDLTNIKALLAKLDHPHEQLTCIHVAGTNGKGSTSHYISSILQQAGFRVALYTSPHLKDFRERIRINGTMISKQDVVKFVNDYFPLFESIQPSFFEITVAMAFWFFRQEKVDYAIIETGLGGRLDSTNVITPLLSVITNISLDHTNMLGNTVKQIAQEKAGIIKQAVPIVIGERQHESDSVFVERARSIKSPLFFAENLESQYYKYIRNGLLGSYQQKNMRTAISALHILNSLESLALTTVHIKMGIQHVVRNTGIRGRWDIIHHTPTAIADVAHNEAGLTEVMQDILKLDYQQLHIVLGVVNDKELDKKLKRFPKDAQYYFCKPDVPRGLQASVLNQEATRFGLLGKSFGSVMDAYETALNAANHNDLIYIGGSTFVVAEVI